MFERIGKKILLLVFQPIIDLMIKLKITPNMITTVGLLLNIVAAGVFIYGAEKLQRESLTIVGWGGFWILIGGLFDVFDGQVARSTGQSSKFGALYDSVLDRYSELVMFFGICFYLSSHSYFITSIAGFIALIGSIMVSYVRSRAEGLGIECKVGTMQRPARVVLIGAGAMFTGIFYHFFGDYKYYINGMKAPVFEPMFILAIPIILVAIFANITAFHRLYHCKGELEKQENKTI